MRTFNLVRTMRLRWFSCFMFSFFSLQFTTQWSKSEKAPKIGTIQIRLKEKFPCVLVRSMQCSVPVETKTKTDTAGRRLIMMTHHWHWGIGKLCWPRESTSGDEKHLVGKGGRAIAKNWRASTKDHFHHSRTHYNKHSQPQQQEATCRPLRPGKTSTCIWIEHLPSKQSRDTCLRFETVLSRLVLGVGAVPLPPRA